MVRPRPTIRVGLGRRSALTWGYWLALDDPLVPVAPLAPLPVPVPPLPSQSWPPRPPGPMATLNELSRWTSTCVPSDFVTVTSYPSPRKSVVTSPAVPLPTCFTAAACALVAASPVTGFSAASCSAEPGAGNDGFGGGDGTAGAVELPDELGVVVVDVAAPAVPKYVAPTAPPATLNPTSAPATASFRMGCIQVLPWDGAPDAHGAGRVPIWHTASIGMPGESHLSAVQEPIKNTRARGGSVRRRAAGPPAGTARTRTADASWPRSARRSRARAPLAPPPPRPPRRSPARASPPLPRWRAGGGRSRCHRRSHTR